MSIPNSNLPAWERSHRADSSVVPIADRHYNRQKIGSPQFAPPGSCCVFKLISGDAVVAYWITSAPFAQYVKHAWPGAWVCSAFRNEGSRRASDLIREAIAKSIVHYGAAPDAGMITFVDPRKVPPTIIRGKKIYGYCFLKAGFAHVGFTKGGLWAWHMNADAMRGC